jgi:hypothetical protein
MSIDRARDRPVGAPRLVLVKVAPQKPHPGSPRNPARGSCLAVGQHHFHGVGAPGPPDVGLGSCGTGRAVASGHETEKGTPGFGR